MLRRIPLTRPARAVLVAVTTLVVTVAVIPTTAQAATRPPVGHVDVATQNSHGVLTVTGWAYDPGRPATSSTVDILVDGRLAARVRASGARPDVNRVRHVPGRHGFSWHATRAKVHTVVVDARPLSSRGKVTKLATRYLNGYRPATATVGSRIVAEAAKYVGKARYVYGGTSPRTGFDCSGYTQYVYRHAGAKALPRTAEQQRRATKRISRAAARPGDLVFYLSGGRAYHVAIYAGHGMQYAAATPRDGIRYQHVWSSAVRYGTNWH